MHKPAELAMSLAEQRPVWELGTGVGYHGMTIGLYLDQLVRRVDPQHRNMSHYFRQEFAIPFGK